MVTVLNTYTIEELREEAQANPNLPWTEQIEAMQREFNEELNNAKFFIDHLKFILLIDPTKPKSRGAICRMINKLAGAARSGGRAVFGVNRVEVICNRGGYSQPMAVQTDFSGPAILAHDMGFKKYRINCLKRLTKNKNNPKSLLQEKALEIYNDISKLVENIRPLFDYCENEVTRLVPGNVLIFAIEVEEEMDSGNDSN